MNQKKIIAELERLNKYHRVKVDGQEKERLVFDLNQEAGTTLVLVTHDLELAQRTQRIIRLKGGKIVADQLTMA